MSELKPCPWCGEIEDALNQRIKELELNVAKMLAKEDTMSCYMCHGGKYLEWVDWDDLTEEDKAKYLKQAEGNGK